jgi:propanediol dehydratase small subunit
MLLLLMMTLATDQTAPMSPAQDEIVVIGQRLSRWTGKYEIRGAKMKCSTKTSTKDIEIDAIGCQAFQVCADTLQSRIAASDDTALDRRARLSMKVEIKRDLTECVKDRRAELVAALAARRAAKEF